MKRHLFVRATAAALASPWTAVGAAVPDRLRIGLTAVILADQAAFLARWAEYLGAHLGIRVGFVTRDEYQALHDLLAGGQIDALWTCGYPFVRFQSRLRLLAVPIYQGQPTYQAYLIRAKADADVMRWSDLRGKVLAFSDPLSNSGWLVAQGQLATAGLGVRDLRRSFFAHGHRNVAEAVSARLANAGSIDGYVWETMRLQGMPAAMQTEVVWKSPFHGFPPIVASAERIHPLLDGLQATLMAMAGNEDGRTLLKALNLGGFIAGQPSMFDSIRQLARSVPGSGVTT